MQAMSIERQVADRFGLNRAPTLLAQHEAGPPIAFTSLRRTGGSPVLTLAVAPEAAFSVQVAIAPTAKGEIWLDGRHIPIRAVAPGETSLFDLATNPIARLAPPFEFVRFYLPTPTLDRLADAQGLRRIGGLRTLVQGDPDPVMHGLALSILPMLRDPRLATALFLDSIALAFHAHMLHRYAGIPAAGGSIRAGLAPWQLRRVHAFVEAHLDGDPSIADLAGECRLSASHFARAFRQAVGMPPHRWVMTRRIERAKSLLPDDTLELAEIALACGFVDQSHFTRIFSRSEGQSPGRWRRLHCC